MERRIRLEVDRPQSDLAHFSVGLVVTIELLPVFDTLRHIYTIRVTPRVRQGRNGIRLVPLGSNRACRVSYAP